MSGPNVVHLPLSLLVAHPPEAPRLHLPTGRGGYGGADETTPLTEAEDGGVPSSEVSNGTRASRDAHLDNCKFFLMCVVVYNHCIQDFFKFLDPATGRAWCAPDSPATMAFGGSVDLTRVARGFYLYLNLLGMPAFTAVSGYCSRGWARDVRRGNGAGVNRRFRGAVESLIAPWLIWQPFYVVYNYRSYPVQLWSPIGVTWYLTALFFWRVSLSALAQVRRSAILPALLVAGIGVGFTETPQTQNGLAFLDFQRAVAFLPVFYFGVTSVTPERLAALKSKTAVALGWFVTVGAALAFVAAIRGASSSFDSEESFGGYGYYCFDEIQRYLWMTSGYDYGGSSTHPSAAPLAHAAYRVAFYVSASAVTSAFAAIVPAEQRWYTSYGSRTMYAYLLHLLLVRGLALAQDLWVPESAQPPLWAQALINFVVLPLAGSVGLMAPWCERAFKWLVEPAKVFGGTWFWRDFWEEEVH
jgi:fucose 4-O-acetylase-like acetyltransferase